MKNITE